MRTKRHNFNSKNVPLNLVKMMNPHMKNIFTFLCVKNLIQLKFLLINFSVLLVIYFSMMCVNGWLKCVWTRVMTNIFLCFLKLLFSGHQIEIVENLQNCFWGLKNIFFWLKHAWPLFELNRNVTIIMMIPFSWVTNFFITQ